tara:strand:- start:660 stop:842 length:183 start_codon:yes stop_codon:yes gene_type:complete
MKIDSTIRISKSETDEKEFATYTLKIPTKLFKQFKIKSLSDDNATYRETLTKLIQDYVSR